MNATHTGAQPVAGFGSGIIGAAVTFTKPVSEAEAAVQPSLTVTV